MVESVGGIQTGLTSGVSRAGSSSASREESQVTQGVIREIKGISPRMRADPVSGVLITEYLDDSGNVEAQFPSEVTVAYLRSGLTETGQVIREEVAPKTELPDVLV